ncbi:hypothetical protein WA538_002947 [Blastocystis sp. DL]
MQSDNTGILDMSHMKKHVTWDEATIAEQDKDRGTRCVIDEPKTPYVRQTFFDEEEEHDNREQLLKRLMELDESLKGRKMVHIATEEKPQRDEEKHIAFLKKRKEHYNEYQTVFAKKHQSEPLDKTK